MATVTPGKVFTSNEVVTPANLNQLGVPTVSLADSEVTTAKIADANVTTAKIADANVTTAKIADANVTTAKIADANVTDAKLATGAVTGAADGGKIAASAITGQTQLADPLASSDEFLVHDTSASALRRVAFNAMQPAGSVLQTVYVETTDRATITNLVPDDDTIPQITEGAQVLTLNITPSSTNNKILLTSVVCVGHSANYGVACCLFRTGTSNALCTVASPGSSDDAYNPSRAITFMDSPNTVSQVTYSLRVGAPISGTKLNDWYVYGPKYGQSIRTTLMAQEIKG